MGCSTHRVPSWSKVAMRCSTGTNVGLDRLTVAWTKSSTAFFEGPSFQVGSGSSAAWDMPLMAPATTNAADALNKSLRVISMKASPPCADISSSWEVDSHTPASMTVGNYAECEFGIEELRELSPEEIKEAAFRK